MKIIDQTIDSIIKESAWNNKEEALKEISLLIALSKRDKYKMECAQYEQKYKMNFQSFENHLRTLNNQEDYEKECDLDDWEFSISSLKRWEQQIEALINVSN